MLLHRFKQSSNEGITAEDRSSLAPPKSLSHNIRYETVPRVGSTTVLFPCGQADITVGLVDDALVVFELAGGLCDAEVELAVGVAPGAVVVIITVTTATGGDDDSGPSEAVLGPAPLLLWALLSPTPRPTGTPTAIMLSAASAATSQNVTFRKPSTLRSCGANFRSCCVK